jgi:hypothetical protein
MTVNLNDGGKVCDEVAGTEKIHVLKCNHRDYISAGINFDVSEFWDGVISSEESKRNHRWAGDFTGRPGLADDLFDAMRGTALNKKPGAIRTLLTHLRHFWRYLDAFEASQSILSINRVDSVAQLEHVHGVMWSRPMSNEYAPAFPEVYRAIYLIIQISLKNLKLPPLFWPPVPNRDFLTRKDTPSIDHGIKLVRILTREAHAIWKRWERADSLAEVGRVLDPQNFGRIYRLNVTEADVHATFRELIRRSGNPLPSLAELYSFVGMSSWTSAPRWWPRHPVGHEREGAVVNIEDDLLPGLYPTATDLYCLSSLFMARSGWNPTTMLGLDCSTTELWCRPYGDSLVWMHSYKYRGGNWQDTISPENHAGHSYQIVIRLLKRSLPLRALLALDSSKCELPEIALRSPWVAAYDSKNIGVLADHSLKRIRDYLKDLVDGYNAGKDVLDRLPVFRPSDFRDVFADAVHRGGNYSILLTQIALGHKSLATTRRYLRSLAWRRESEGQLNFLVTALFDQIEVHKKIDFAVLRANMDGVEITQEQINRLEVYRKNRTYSGLGCSDPTNPPEWIDPRNPRDGSEVCKQGHRCPSCPKGRVFDDSLPHIARYAAELEWKQKNYGDIRWYQSTDCLDLEVYRQTLKQWPASRVEKELEFWRSKLNSGEHSVLIFSAGVQ